MMLRCLIISLAFMNSLAFAGRHCGAEGDWKNTYIPDYAGAEFGPACSQHDRCYDTFGANKDSCDSSFLKKLRSQCWNSDGLKLIPAALEFCYAAAQGFYEAVHLNGQEAFDKAQQNPKYGRRPATDAGLYSNQAGTILYANGEGAYCGFVSPEHFELVSTDWGSALNNTVADSALAGLRYDGSCKVKIPTGFFDVPGVPGIYFSNGEDAYCWVPAPRFVTGAVHEYSFNIYEHTSMRRDGACPGMN